MTSRFRNSDEIVGQFLPKIYTRRITLEDTKVGKIAVFHQQQESGRRRRIRRKIMAPGTAITVDFQIKDVLSPEGLGVITNNQNQDEDPNNIQNEILSSLKTAVILFNDNSVFETMFNTIRSFSAFGWRLSLPSVMPSFEQYLLQTVQNLNRIEERVLLHIRDARPETIGFEVRNSQYQEYDANNNLVNVIPYKHVFSVENESFQNCDNLSMICFTYFDFSSLSLDEITPDEVKRLGYITGDITADVITRGGRVESTAIVYKDAITNQPYYGPVHTMGGGRIMTGITHKENSRLLITRRVPLTKIQDFRSFERLKETNFQPPIIQSFDEFIPSLDLIEKNNKDFFDVEDIIVDFDRMEKVANIEFTIDMSSVYEQSRYYDLVKSNQSNIMFGYPALLDLLEITVCRRRVTKRSIGNNRLGAPSRVPFDQVEEEDYIVATSGQNQSSTSGVEGRKITTKEDIDSKIMEMEVPGFAGLIRRRFFVEDRQVADFLGTGAVFQYGIKIRVKDPTKDRFINLLETARLNLQQLDLYAQESIIPVFDSRMIIKVDPTQPVSLDNIRDKPQYGDSVQQGNYDTVSKTFTSDFITRSRRKYNLQSYVDNYIELIEVSFAKSSVSMYNFSTPVQGNDGERGMVNEGIDVGNADGIRMSPIDLLMSSESLSMESANTAMYNMINPSNARPETIRSFIKGYQDLVMDLEDYFDIGYQYSLTTEGNGYRGRGDNTIRMERWFSGVDENADGSPTESDNYIDMSPMQLIFFRFWREGDLQRGLGIPRITEAAYQSRVDRERERFPSAAIDVATANLTPMSIVIGDDEVFFDEEEMERERRARQAREKAEALENESKLRVYHEKKRQGRQPAKKPGRRRKRKKRLILGSREDGKLISNFLEELNSMQERNDFRSVGSIIGALNSRQMYSGPSSSDPSNIYTPSVRVAPEDPIDASSSSAEPQDAFSKYFNLISSITEEITDAAFQYSNSIEELERANRTLSDIDIGEYVNSNISCGLIDNRPQGNEIIDETNRFNREEGLYPGLMNLIQPIIIETIPSIPQSTAPNFPTGRVFTESSRSFPPTARPSLPTTVPPVSIPTQTLPTPGSQPRVPRSVPIPPDLGAVRRTSAELPSPPTLPVSAGRSATTRSTARQSATQRATSNPFPRASTSTPSVPMPGTGNFRSARTSTSSSPSPRSGGSMPNMTMPRASGPRTGGYGY